ncbi:MAG: hypothetical protein CVT84_11790 [Alphaproteobacteria bacterium HGW-Alphaproteobacteria-6]|nr:MAG: hypothetical protein CVT84_11790 [Alphaproteobacteria bacterium HGW-Alphaproteobacteria-6]
MKHSNVNHKIEPWTITTDAALAHLDSSAQGLTEAEARQRLVRFGPNRLKEKPQRPVWMKFLDQFKNLLVIVLIGAAALAGAIGDIKDAVVILVVVVFNACLGFYQEYRAEATLAALGDALAAGDDLVLPPFGKLRINRQRDLPTGAVMTLRLRRRAAVSDTAPDTAPDIVPDTEGATGPVAAGDEPLAKAGK